MPPSGATLTKPPAPTAGGHLVLRLKRGDVLLVGGALLRLRTEAELELMSQARFVYGSQYMPEGEARTPLRRLYFLLQQAYAGPEPAREACAAEARAALGSASPSLSRDVEDAVRSGRFHPVLSRLRDAIRFHEGAERAAAGG